MESKIKLFGHPIHPMLIVLPLGLFIGAIITDTINLINGNTALAAVSYFNISIGIVTGLLAAIFGFLDWLAVPSNTRAKYLGGWHGLGNVVVVLIFAASWGLRRGSIGYEPNQTALLLSYTAILIGTVTAWLGGEMVYRLRIGVDSGANPDAPNSLSNKSAQGGTRRSNENRQQETSSSTKTARR
jgi:uncharacterized membrane protein